MATIVTHLLMVKELIHAPGGAPIRGIFTNDTFFRAFGPSIAADGDTTYDWVLKTNGVAGTVCAEAAAFTAADTCAYSRATLAPTLYDATVRVTRHLAAATKRGKDSNWDGIADDTAEAVAGIKDAVMTQWLGAATDGIQLAIDATNVYAGLDHAAVAGWDSRNPAVGGVQTLAVWEDEREALMDNDRGGFPNIALLPLNQITNHIRLAGPSATQPQTRYPTAAGVAPNVDAGMQLTNVQWAGIPLVGVPDMTDTLIFLGQRDNVKILHWEEVPGDGGWKVVAAGADHHYEDTNISWFGGLYFEDPYRWSAMTGVTA